MRRKIVRKLLIMDKIISIMDKIISKEEGAGIKEIIETEGENQEDLTEVTATEGILEDNLKDTLNLNLTEENQNLVPNQIKDNLDLNLNTNRKKE